MYLTIMFGIFGIALFDIVLNDDLNINESQFVFTKLLNVHFGIIEIALGFIVRFAFGFRN